MTTATTKRKASPKKANAPQVAVVQVAKPKGKPFDPSLVEKYLNWSGRITRFYPSGSKDLKEVVETKGFTITNGVWTTVGPEKLSLVDDPNNSGRMIRVWYREGEWEVREYGAFTSEEENVSDLRIVEYRKRA